MVTHLYTHLYTHLFLLYYPTHTLRCRCRFRFLFGPLYSKSVHLLRHLGQFLLGFLKLLLELREAMVRLFLSTRLSLLTTVRLVDAAIIGVMGVCRATMLVTESTVLLSLLGTSSILARATTLALVATSLVPTILAAVAVVLSLSLCNVLGRDYVWGLQYHYKGDVAMMLKMKL